MRIATVGVFTFAVLAASALACDDGSVLTEDSHHAIYARAADVEELKKQTKPTLVYDEREFLWTAVAADGKRYFTHATAYENQIPGTKKGDILILGKGNPPSGMYRARVTAAVDEKMVPSQPPISSYLPRTVGAGATILSQHKTYGTLYQLSIDRGTLDDVREHSEERILVMHDPVKGWRYVATIWGNWSETSGSPETESGASRRIVRTSVEWTGKNDMPLKIVCRASVSQRQEEAAVAWEEKWTMSGVLPLEMPERRERTITVKAGDSLAKIAARLAPWSYEEITAGRMQKDLVALNPRLKKDPDSLRAGDKLVIPDLSAVAWTKGKARALAGR